MTNTTPPFAELLQIHRAAYLRTLPDRLAELDTLAAHLNELGPGAARTQALERCAHRIAGSAGTFGLTDLGDAARTLELVLDDDADGAPGEVAAALVTLRELLRQVTGATQRDRVGSVR